MPYGCLITSRSQVRILSPPFCSKLRRKKDLLTCRQSAVRPEIREPKRYIPFCSTRRAVHAKTYRSTVNTGRAGVTIAGGDCYLGPWKFRGSIAEYDRLIAERLARGRPSYGHTCFGKLGRTCFSPIESEKARLAELHANCKTPLSCGNRPGTNRKKRPKRKARDRYDVDMPILGDVVDSMPDCRMAIIDPSIPGDRRGRLAGIGLVTRSHPARCR